MLGGGGYLFAASYTNHETTKWAEKLGGGSFWRRGQGAPTDREMARAQQLEEAKVCCPLPAAQHPCDACGRRKIANGQAAQERLNKLPSALSFLPQFLLVPILRTYVIWEEWVLNSPPAQVAPTTLIAGMGGVFLLWRIRRLEPWMRKWWLHRPVVFGGPGREWQNCVTLLTSVVSTRSTSPTTV